MRKRTKQPHSSPRYGRTVRRRFAEIEVEMRRGHTCPSCSSHVVKRDSVGVWKCRRCDLTFAGGAYTPKSKIGELAERRARARIP